MYIYIFIYLLLILLVLLLLLQLLLVQPAWEAVEVGCYAEDDARCVAIMESSSFRISNTAAHSILAGGGHTSRSETWI